MLPKQGCKGARGGKRPASEGRRGGGEREEVKRVDLRRIVLGALGSSGCKGTSIPTNTKKTELNRFAAAQQAREGSWKKSTKRTKVCS